MFLILSIMAGFFISFMLTVLTKWGVIEFMQAHAPNDLFFRMFSCYFCMGFWIGSLWGLVFAIAWNPAYLLMGIIVAPIVKVLS